MRLDKKIQLAITASLMLMSNYTFASTTQVSVEKDYNMVLISLVSLMLILLFVIGILANVLRQLTFVVRDKIRKDAQKTSNVVKTILLVIAFSIPTLHAGATNTEKTAVAISTNISGIPSGDFYAIMSVIILELVVIFALVIFTRQLLKAISNKPELAKVVEKVVQKNWFWDKFNAAVPMEKEKDLLLDHNYDGIQELDNSLPPWWKYGFYLTIIVAVIYMYRYQVANEGLTQYDEYVAEMQKGEEDKANYLATSANNVDESTVIMLTDAKEIAVGKELFIKTCAACHLADGGGIVGPNLTDNYWIHGGSIKDIFKTIKYGWQDKGMKSWKDDFSPKQIQQLASFVKSLKGTHPTVPKIEQGELYIEATVSSASADPAKNKVQ